MTEWVEFHPATGKPVAYLITRGKAYRSKVRPYVMHKNHGGPVAIVREKKPALDGRKLGCH